jgi:hypothetical protein
MSTGHLVDKTFFFLGIVFVLSGFVGFKRRFSERASIPLAGLSLVAMTLRWMAPLSSDTQGIMETLGLVGLCATVLLNWFNWRRRKSSGAAA